MLFVTYADFVKPLDLKNLLNLSGWIQAKPILTQCFTSWPLPASLKRISCNNIHIHFGRCWIFITSTFIVILLFSNWKWVLVNINCARGFKVDKYCVKEFEWFPLTSWGLFVVPYQINSPEINYLLSRRSIIQSAVIMKFEIWNGRSCFLIFRFSFVPLGSPTLLQIPILLKYNYIIQGGTTQGLKQH